MTRFLTTAAGRALGFGTVLVFAGWWSATLFRERWAVRIPDERHTYGIRVRGGVDLFYPPPLGWFVDHALWIFLALAIMTIVAEWATRSRQQF
ncbi:MAG TPA: hypothetical protein VH417_03000 [Vicinamibacterales bacterium]|jgi:hypothetical protein